MSLNIKNKETYRLGNELARASGESLTVAVREAIRERLERVLEKSSNNLAECLLEIGRDCAAHLRKPAKSIDHGEFLYDEDGLPK